MKRILIALAVLLTVVLLALAAAGGWYVYTKQPQRNGRLALNHLSAPVTVRYDERGVPHIDANTEADMYRALGYVQAQDRLFQMEIMRRLANGELAEVMGPTLLGTDKLFRTLDIRRYAQEQAAALDPSRPATQALLAYLDGVNQYQAGHPAPMEFDLLHLPKRDFTPADTLAVNAYMAYSFAAAFKSIPVLTFIRDKLGPQYLAAFDIDWHPEGGVQALSASADWDALQKLTQVSQNASALSGVAALDGSNAWAIGGKRTASGKPLLAGDPHIGFSAPAVWYEAQLSCPGFDLYGHFLALNPTALLGHNNDFGWTLTVLGNADVDLIAETLNPANANQVWYQNQWVDMESHTETIHVKDAADVYLKLRRSPHGPIVTDAFAKDYGRTPVAMWWAYMENDNPLLDAFYALNRAATLDQGRAAASQIHAPGLNLVWANAKGDIAWWAAARLPQRPAGVNPLFILDAAKGEGEKPGFYNFTFNPQEENPARGYIVSANSQPISSVPMPGYYRVPDRYIELERQLADPKRRWSVDDAKALQLDPCNGYPKRLLKELLPVMEQVVTDPNERAFMEPLQKWDGCFVENSVAATLFSELSYQLAHAAFADELGEERFNALLQTPAIDFALPMLAADANSPWWDNINTPQVENRYETVRVAWAATLAHLMDLYGTSLMDWAWQNTHTLTYVHPLGRQKPLDHLFNVGPFYVPGGRETPNNFSGPLASAPWAVEYGPSTRRVIDFAKPDKAWGSNPLGQSGVLFDRHYADQAKHFIEGGYVHERLSQDDVQAHTASTLILRPGAP